MFGIRVIVFVLSLLAATKVLDPTWEVFAILLVLGLLSIRDAYSVAFVLVEAILLTQAPNASDTLIVLAPILAGISTFRAVSFIPGFRRANSGLRLLAFILTLALAAEVIDPSWQVFAVLLVIGAISMRDVYGLGFVVTTAILLAEAPDVSQAVLIIAAVLAGLSALRVTVDVTRPWHFSWSNRSDWYRVAPAFRLRPGADRRLRRWSEAGER